MRSRSRCHAGFWVCVASSTTGGSSNHSPTPSLDEAWLANKIFDAHRDDPEFGYRFLADEVRADGHDVGDRTVWRICSTNRWWCSFGKPRRNRKATRPATAAHDDLVQRRFKADGPNQVWVADLTEHRTGEGKLYVCAIKDLWSNRIVGWAIDSRMKARIVVAAIEMAVARRGDVAGCILHSDRGSQFRARKVHRALTKYAMAGSMGNVGTAADNAAMESFFALLQRNVLNTRRWLPVTNSGSPSSAGSNGPTTVDDARPLSAG